jgi:hypothetical protein
MNPRGRTIQGLLVLASLAFLLPFMTISCNGTKLVSLSGVQLLTGTTITPPGGGRATPIQPSPLLIAAFAFGIVAILIRRKNGSAVNPWLSIGATAGSVGAMLFFQTASADQVQQQTLAVFTVQMEIGYWVAAVCYAAATMIGVVDWNTERTVRGVMVTPTQSPEQQRAQLNLDPPPMVSSPHGYADGSRPQQRFCSSCGQPHLLNARFCINCGEALNESRRFGGRVEAT